MSKTTNHKEKDNTFKKLNFIELKTNHIYIIMQNQTIINNKHFFENLW